MKEMEEEEMVSSARLEPGTLQWSERDALRTTENHGDLVMKHPMKTPDSMSLHGTESQTESEIELRSRGEKLNKQDSLQMEREIDGVVEKEEQNILPEKAAQVFSPAVTILHSASLPASPRGSEAFWDMETEKSPFLGAHSPPAEDYYPGWVPEEGPSKCVCCRGNRDALKVGVSLFTAGLLFPFLVWGGYVFLPFDAPLLDSTPVRLVYTLRCSVFATVPIILGWLVLGVSLLKSGNVREDRGGQEVAEVRVHRRFLADSTSLFLLYFLQLIVMAMYLNQEQLKLVPLLTIVFALGRLFYWVAAALTSSIRGFGYGLSFLPILAMLIANLYFIFSMDSLFEQEPTLITTPPASKQRFWG